MKARPKRVEIAGGIASGKTTLARLLRNAGFTPILERFRENPFYAAFYRDPVGVALETELTYLLQHYHEQKLAAKANAAFCADFSLVLDQAYADVTLRPADRPLFELVRERVSLDLPRRSLLIHLDCSPEIELRRIRRRDRRAERAITLRYLQQIDRALKRCVSRLRGSERTMVIDSGNLNFAQKREGKVQALALVKRILDL
jgi:deoxyguanosine kinase